MSGHDAADDAALLARAADDVDALEALYRRYVRRVAAFAARRCPSADDVADVVAGTFDRLLRYAHRYDAARGPVVAFVFAVAGSVIADQRRREARDRALVTRLSGRDLLDSDDVTRIEAAIDAALSVDELAPALECLTAGEGAVLQLVAAGLSPAEAAARLDITPNAARVRLARARQRVRSHAGIEAGTPVPTATARPPGPAPAPDPGAGVGEEVLP